MIEEKVKALLHKSIPVYIGELPSAATDAVALELFDGNFNTEYFNKGTLCNPIIRVIVRAKSYQKAQEWIEQIKECLHRHTDDYFLSILMHGYPKYLGKDPQKLHEFQIVFSIKVKE